METVSRAAPKAAGATEGGNAAFGGDARAGEDDDSFRGGQSLHQPIRNGRPLHSLNILPGLSICKPVTRGQPFVVNRRAPSSVSDGQRQAR